MDKSNYIKIKTPVDEKLVAKLKAGDRVLITGKIFTARDAAHQTFGQQPPFETKGAIIYYASPTPTKKGAVIGSIGPTTSSRMDSFTPALLKAGIKITIGKGDRSAEVVEAIKKYKAVYLVVPGGAAALLAKHVKKSAIIAYPNLQSEAVHELEAHDFPATVAIDSKGHNLFEK
jgi:fumarate hydratase subunit beta